MDQPTPENRARGSRPRLGPAGPAFLLLLALLLDVSACVSRSSLGVVPIPAAASARHSEARAALEAGDADRAREAAEEALALAPDWVAPRRVLDDLESRALRGAQALGARLEELAERPDDAGLAYLTARLEGREGVARLARAASLEPALAWPHHAVAWNHFLVGDAKAAVRPGREALERARDPWEHAYFATALARYLIDLDRTPEAVEVLEVVLGEVEGLALVDRFEISSWLVVAELASEDPVLAERGFRRAIELFAKHDPTEAQCRRLYQAARVARRDGPELALELDAALAARPGRDVLRAEVLLDIGPEGLAFEAYRELRTGWTDAGPQGPALRAAWLAAGRGGAMIEDWLASLPAMVRAEDGLPREPRLRRLVAAARVPDSRDASVALGEALLAAGWFQEARGHAAHLARLDLEAGLALDARAARGRVLLLEIGRLFATIDAGRGGPGVWSGLADDSLLLERLDDPGGSRAGRPGELDDLDDLLVALQPLFERYHGPKGGGVSLGTSPLLTHGPASIVHPGPRFSPRDEAEGLGAAGTPVPGLAAELAAIGRFGIFGKALGGGGPDATVRRVLAIETVEGEHLGVPFSGTVVWCQGADLTSRPARRGARITGAALHEGYWIDVDRVHDDWRHWRGLAERLRNGEAGDPAIALAGRGARVDTAQGTGTTRTRRALYATAGLGDLLRLRVLVDRGASEGTNLVPLEELVRMVAVHEEGHLCDRTRFLPLGRHLLAAFGFLLEARFSPERINETLEYRAQLVCLCEVDDPRLPLADLLDSASNEGGLTAHAGAYRRLLRDLVGRLDDELEAHPSIDGEHFLVHQLHHLDAEQVRALGREVARRKGMVAKDG